MEHKKYEYHAIQRPENVDTWLELKLWLNILGHEGWELTSVVDDDGYIFKRAIINQPS